MNRRNFFLLFVLFSFFAFPAFSMEIKSLFPIAGLHWTLETTEGFQTVSNADGDNQYEEQILSAKGIIFHSFYDDFLLTRIQVNLGFSQKPNFLWTEQPNLYSETNLNTTLRSMELDVQKFFPFVRYGFLTISFFGAYSYFEISTFNSHDRNSTKKFLYNSFSGGIESFVHFSKFISQQCYISYSPIVIYGYGWSSFVRFINYGFEFRTNTFPVALTLFYNAKHAFMQKGVAWFNGIKRSMDSSETGFSIRFSF